VLLHRAPQRTPASHAGWVEQSGFQQQGWSTHHPRTHGLPDDPAINASNHAATHQVHQALFVWIRRRAERAVAPVKLHEKYAGNGEAAG